MKVISTKKIAGITFDFYDDFDFLKDACDNEWYGKLIPLEDTVKLADDSFALKLVGKSDIKRAYPIYNEYATGLSALYLQKHASELEPDVLSAAIDEIKEAADHFNLKLDMDLDSLREEGFDHKRILKNMNDNLVTHLKDMTAEEKVASCTEFSMAAGDDIDDRLKDYVLMNKLGEVEIGLGQREQLVINENNPMLTKLWENTLEKIGNYKDDILKAIEILSNFDKQAGFDSYYSGYLADILPDAYKTILQKRNEKECGDRNERVLDRVGQTGMADYFENEVKKQEIMELAARLCPKHFGGRVDLYKFFMKDPIGMYETSPAIRSKIDDMIKQMKSGKINVE